MAKKKLKKYKNGGVFKQADGDNTLFLDMLSAYGNTVMGQYGVDPMFDVDNEFLDRTDDVTNKIMGTGTKIGASIAAPGIGGAIAGAGQNAIGSAVNPALEPNQPTTTQEPMNIDPRFQRLAQGGSIIQQNPQTNGTDTMPIDAQGNPASVSGKKAVALTDSGEVIWNGYVFSEDRGYADKAKSVLKRYKMRLGEDFDGVDRLSKDQMDAEFSKLADEQEADSPMQLQQQPLPSFVGGGNINTGLYYDEDPPSKYGGAVRWKDRHDKVYPQDPNAAPAFNLGLSQYNNTQPGYGVLANDQSQLASSYSQPGMQKYRQRGRYSTDAEFASLVAPPRQTSQFELFPQQPQVASSTNSAATNIGRPSGMTTLDGGYIGGAEAFLGDYEDIISPTSQYMQPSSIEPFNASKAATIGGMAAAGQVAGVGSNIDGSAAQGLDDGSSKGGFGQALDWLGNNPAETGAIMQGIALAARAGNIMSTPKNVARPATYDPEMITLAEERDEARKNRNRSAAQLRSMSSQSRAGQIAATTALDESLSGVLGNSYLRERSYNAQERNRSRQYNATARFRADEINAQEDAARTNMIDSMLSQASNIGTGYARDKQLEGNQDLMLKVLNQANPNYEFSEADKQIILRILNKQTARNKK